MKKENNNVDLMTMEKCRICLKYRKKLRSLYIAEDGITLLDMLTSFTNMKIISERNIPNKLCLSCRKKLKEAYNFKIEIERTELILNEAAAFKRIYFNNINDVKIDFKPLLSLKSESKNIFEFDENTVTYNETVIKKINIGKDYGDGRQITVKELLNSVKMESDDNCYDQDYEIDAEYDINSDLPEYGKKNKRNKKNYQKAVKVETKATNQMARGIVLKKPIRPILLKDAIIKHKSFKENNEQPPKKKYYYPPKTGVCPYCGKLLMRKYLNNHILVHKGERTFKCDQCSKTFISSSMLNQHVKVHTDSGKYKCDLCIANFYSKTTLESHMIVHSEHKNHICDICHKGFKRKYTLSRHMLVHNFGQKSIQCEVCSKTFNSKCLLKNHMRVHTGERPYKCEICSQPYSYKHDFNRHCLKKHGIFLKRRLVNIMNEEVLQQERALMRDLALRAHGVIVGADIPSVFKGPQGALAFEQAMKAVEAKQIPITYTETTYRL